MALHSHQCSQRRYKVATPTPVCREIVRQEAPEARRAATLEESTIRRGRPSFRPFARALRSPALPAPG